MNTQEIERMLYKQFKYSIWSKLQKCIYEYELIENGDTVSLNFSGTAQSAVICLCVKRLQSFSKLHFRTKCFCSKEVSELAAQLGLDARECDCADGGKITSDECFDDVIEDILGGMLFEGRISAIMPKLKDTGIIRPLYTVRRADVYKWARLTGLDFKSSECPLHQRMAGEILARQRELNDFTDINVFRSVQNVNLQTLISYIESGQKHSFLDNYQDGMCINER